MLSLDILINGILTKKQCINLWRWINKSTYTSWGASNWYRELTGMCRAGIWCPTLLYGRFDVKITTICTSGGLARRPTGHLADGPPNHLKIRAPLFKNKISSYTILYWSLVKEKLRVSFHNILSETLKVDSPWPRPISVKINILT